MRLESIWVHGLRRFGGERPHRLRLDNKLVCIIGANEVGKSTLLDALVMSREENRDPETNEPLPVDPLLLTRGEEIPGDRQLVRARYRLEQADCDALAAQQGAAQLKEVRWLERTLYVTGEITTTFDPTPVRDKASRHNLAGILANAMQSKYWPADDDRMGTPADPNTLVTAIERLGGSSTYLGSVLDSLTALADWLDDSQEQLSDWVAESKAHRGLADLIRQTVETERIDHPVDQAINALSQRIPRFVRFDMAERGIADEYDLASPDLPEPLLNLAELGGLDLERLYEKVTSGETGTVEDLRDAANEQLADIFKAWSQEPEVKVSFGVSGTRLLVHVKSGSGPSMRLGERSEGLRQFVALVAMTAHQGHLVPPILLIDEVEMHLHYDAQADLIGVLAEQETAAQVVYTTHSAACLPEDLGSAVRVVEGVDDLTASRIRSQFWSEDVGLGTLLMAMGAASLALVLLRPAALVEGGAELVLLPSLISEAIGAEILGFQVVPGGAEVSRERVIGLDLHGTATVWIYDGDEGGQAKQKWLTDQGVDANRIFLLQAGGNALELEDFIRPAVYVAAVNQYGSDVGAGDKDFTENDLPDHTCARHDAVERWFADNALRAPSKVAIANKVLERRGDYELVDPKRKRTLVALHSKASHVFAEDIDRRMHGP